MRWFQKSMPLAGSVLFRGSLPPKLGDLRLPPGATLTPGEPNAGAHWVATARSTALGEAKLICLRDPMRPPREMFEYDGSLTDEEKAEAAQARSIVGVQIEQSAGHVLRDRKRLLTWLGALFDESGLIAMDHASTRSWSRAMLDDELAHDADVDVGALFAIHAITDADDEDRCGWFHTHGLNALGKVDFDVLRPSQSFCRNGDAVRALAFAVLEDRLRAGTTDWVAFEPGGVVGATDARAFDAAAPADERALRDAGPGDDGVHTRDRIVLTDPPARPGLLGRLFGRRDGVRASRALMNFPDDRALLFFSADASALAAERAQKTWNVLRAARDELDGLGFPAIVKIAYPTDSGGFSNAEHLWFEVHEMRDDSVDATLMNQPFDIAAMKEGQRGEHAIERMSDWQLMTPLGSITPRSTVPLRVLRSRPEALARIRAERAKEREAE